MKPKTVRVNDKVQRGYTYELVAPAGPFRPPCDDQGRPACLSRRPASSHSNPAKVISLMDALRQSVDAERGGNVREKATDLPSFPPSATLPFMIGPAANPR
jgi:hypothetical protein